MKQFSLFLFAITWFGYYSFIRLSGIRESETFQFCCKEKSAIEAGSPLLKGDINRSEKPVDSIYFDDAVDLAKNDTDEDSIFIMSFNAISRHQNDL